MRILGAHALFAGALLISPLAAAAANDTARVEVSGPVTGGRGAAFSLPTFDLASHGYVAEEFFLAGSAHGYRMAAGAEQGADGRWQTERDTETVPFRTRILVVRPKAASDFNGTVVVHWQNVTAGYELGTVAEGTEPLRGYAWVGVSAQAVGVNGFPGPEAAGLKQWDSERYGSLDHPGDNYSYDIFTQAGRAVGPSRSKAPVDPMASLDVKRLIAAGASQSAARLRTYIDGVHPLEKAFDGFIPYIDFGSTIPFTAAPGQRPNGRQSTLVRDDLGAPVFVVNSETETEAYLPARQPDTDRFRFWEVAGTSHVTVARSAVATAVGLDSPNWLSYTPVYDAAIRHMHVWLTRGTPPPLMPRIETVASAEGAATVKRDADGNALGGVRLPDMTAPGAAHNGRGKPVQGGSRFAFLYGQSREFSAEELAKRYPNRGVFLGRYDQALESAVKAGVVLKEEAPALRAAAVSWAEKSLPAG